MIDASHLRFLRVRDDKQFANSSRVIENNMLDSLVTMGVLQRRMSIMMRKMHNRAKFLMYRKSPLRGSFIVDVGSGQRGDITKWEGSSWVLALEPDMSVIAEFKRRMRNRNNMELLCCRTSSYRKVIRSMGRDKADIVSLFFCLNLFNNDDLSGLYRILESITSDKCRIIVSLPINVEL